VIATDGITNPIRFVAGQKGKQMQILKEKIVRYETDGSIVKGYDAGELIRCKDCDWYGIVELKQDGTVDMRHKPSWCFLWRSAMNVDDYCSYAVRKEE
jgi:hypothetical protein